MKSQYGIKLTADGQAVPVRLEDTLESLQKQVGGYIEHVPQVAEELILVNEEGKLLGLPKNPLASALTLQDIVGDALMLAGTDGENYVYYTAKDAAGISRMLNAYSRRCVICWGVQP